MPFKLIAGLTAVSLAATTPTCGEKPVAADAPTGSSATAEPSNTAPSEQPANPESFPMINSEKSTGALDYADKTGAPNPDSDLQHPEGTRSAETVIAGGCFWCTEAVFEQLRGIQDVQSVYAGGTKETANYRAVSTGSTGHAEAIKITYDPSKISYGQILKVFFTVAHDPTQKNRQGPDVGPQYRSAVFYANEDEQRVAEAYMKKLNESGYYPKPLATTLEPLGEYYVAEDYHQDYARNNPSQPYIMFQAAPKVEKVQEKFPEQLAE